MGAAPWRSIKSAGQTTIFLAIAMIALCEAPANAQHFCANDHSCEAAFITCELRRRTGQPHVNCEATLAVCRRTCVWDSVFGPCRVISGCQNFR
jgi:hypothetical protein